jgi:hypothetical protein
VLPLIAALDLKPTSGVCELSLDDGDGPGLVGRYWRGHPMHHGDYQPTVPAVQGADLIVRQDPFDRLISIADAKRMHAGLTVSYRDAEA